MVSFSFLNLFTPMANCLPVLNNSLRWLACDFISFEKIFFSMHLK